jgi:hypothetical protein
MSDSFIVEPNQRFDSRANVLETDDDEGGTLIDFDPQVETADYESDHYENLADDIDEQILDTMATDLIRGIEDDQRSRQEWMSQRARELDILGLKIEAPRSDLGSSAAPMEGMSSVRHPLVLEAVLRFQANARAELLPSGGPLKIDNEGQETAETSNESERLEKDCNIFLTSTCSEYVPDTDKLLFGVGSCGAGFKKGYHHPLKRRPTLESVDAEDLIISNTATDLQSAARITHVIKMSKTVLTRMQIAGAYREVELSTPEDSVNQVDKKVGRIQGIDPSGVDPRDVDHTIYECYCDYDIPGYEHRHRGKITGLPIPYKVTIDKTSRKILEVRRDWREGDEECIKRKTFVMYSFIPWKGLYPLGLMHILGNTSNALTAAWRIALDNGMFHNFPGFLFALTGTGQDKNSFRVAPGSGVGVNVGADGKLSDKIMPLPYGALDPSFLQLIENVGATGQRVGGTAETNVGEGVQNAPVGTTLAMIEQATKIMSAVHKRLHASQAEEFQILKDLLQEDPEALWRHRKGKQRPWDEVVLREALENCDLIPVADPNTPSHMHRMARAEAFAQKVAANPSMFDLKKVYEYYFHAIGIDGIDEFFAPPQPPQAAQPDPNVIKSVQAAHAAVLKNQTDQQANQTKLLDIQTRAAEGEANRKSKERIEQLKIAERLAVHPSSQMLLAGSENPGGI